MDVTSGILIRKTRLTDSSLIATWFGDKSGKIKTVIHSALKPGGKFSGKADLFYEAEVFYTRPRTGDLCQLQDLELRHRFESSNYSTMMMCSYFAELIDITTELFHPVPPAFSLLQRAVLYLDSEPPSLRALHYFEKELCRHLGIFDDRVPPDSHYHVLFEYGGKHLGLRGELMNSLQNTK